MKKKQTPEKVDPQKDIEVKKAILAHLEEAFRLAGSCVIGIQYFEDADVVRIRHTDGDSECIDAKKSSALWLLYRTLSKTEPYLYYPKKEKSSDFFWDKFPSRIFKRAKYAYNLD